MNKETPQYHIDNPQIYESFVRTTFEAISRGHKKFSAEFIFNIMRWLQDDRAKDDMYKINNNYKAFYARKFMEDYPIHKGIFETRKSKYD